MVLLQGSSLKKSAVSESNSKDEDERDEEPASKVTTFREAIDLGNDMTKFLTERGEEELSESMFKIVQRLESAKLQHSKQTSIRSFSS